MALLLCSALGGSLREPVMAAEAVLPVAPMPQPQDVFLPSRRQCAISTVSISTSSSESDAMLASLSETNSLPAPSTQVVVNTAASSQERSASVIGSQGVWKDRMESLNNFFKIF